MNNTALRAEAQSANNTHMVFANEEHEKFYNDKLEQDSMEAVRIVLKLYTGCE